MSQAGIAGPSSGVVYLISSEEEESGSEAEAEAGVRRDQAGAGTGAGARDRPPAKVRTTIKQDKGKGKAKAVEADEDGMVNIDDEIDDQVSDDEIEGARPGLDKSLPPLSNLDQIWEDLVKNANHRGGIARMSGHFVGRPLRIATMCSGLEAPILALEGIQKAIKQITGKTFEFVHVFAAEVAKPIQKYIDRTFNTLVFTDVEELYYEIGNTTMGPAQVPLDVDILVAGFPCVDFSGLNKHRKQIGDGGKSGSVFFAIWEYIDRAKPPLVILENVSGCEWETVIARLDQIGYDATFKPVDTKKYYLPQSRRRAYLIATHKSFSFATLIKSWKTELERLERPASSSIEEFLLPTNPILDANATKRVGSTTQVKWKKINQRARADEHLGAGRVLTNGPEDDSTPSLVDGTAAANRFIARQTPRWIDVFNIHVLRAAKDGVDLTYKTRMTDSQQGVHFGQGSAYYGVSACLVRTMLPFLTNLGRTLTGRECLAIQGIPLDRVDLGDLSDAQLSQLAGNAMSTTVVGAAVLAALLVGYPALPSVSTDQAPPSPSASDCGRQTSRAEVESECTSFDEDVEPAAHEPIPTDLFDRAEASSARCKCEGNSYITTNPLVECTSCGRICCSACKPSRGHSFKPKSEARDDPTEVFSLMTQQLPTRIRLDNFDQATLRSKAGTMADLDLEKLSDYINHISSTVDGTELRFQSLVRKEQWVATYSAPNVTVSASFAKEGAEWTVRVKPPADLPVEDQLRNAFALPVARMAVKSSTSPTSDLEGDWKVGYPAGPVDDQVEFNYVGKTVPSWRASLGLTDFLTETRNDKIEVESGATSRLLMQEAVAGVYELQPDCGTACASLYKRISLNSDGPRSKPMFLFFDPTRDGPDDLDTFVFASNHARLGYGEARETVCILEPSWRPNDKRRKESVGVDVARTWVESNEVRLVGVGVRVSDLIEAGVIKPTKFVRTEVGQAAGGGKKRTAATAGPAKLAKRRKVERAIESEDEDEDESESTNRTVSSDSESDDVMVDRRAFDLPKISRPMAKGTGMGLKKALVTVALDSESPVDDDDDSSETAVHRVQKKVPAQIQPRAPASSAKKSTKRATPPADSDSDELESENCLPVRMPGKGRAKAKVGRATSSGDRSSAESESDFPPPARRRSPAKGKAKARAVVESSPSSSAYSSPPPPKRQQVSAGKSRKEAEYGGRGGASGQRGVVSGGSGRATGAVLVSERRGRSQGATPMLDLTLDSDDDD